MRFLCANRFPTKNPSTFEFRRSGVTSVGKLLLKIKTMSLEQGTAFFKSQQKEQSEQYPYIYW